MPKHGQQSTTSMTITRRSFGFGFTAMVSALVPMLARAARAGQRQELRASPSNYEGDAAKDATGVFIDKTSGVRR